MILYDNATDRNLIVFFCSSIDKALFFCYNPIVNNILPPGSEMLQHSFARR